jgi:hypothetical protein
MKKISVVAATLALAALMVTGVYAQDQSSQAPAPSAPNQSAPSATEAPAPAQPAAPAAAPSGQDQSAQPATPATPASPASPSQDQSAQPASPAAPAAPAQPAAPSAQDQSAQQPAAGAAASNSDVMNRTSFTGCLSGTEDNYILKDEKSGELFRLHSDKDIGEHVNKEVTVIGRVQDQQREHQAQNEKASEQATGATIPQHGINVDDIKDAGGSCGQSQK